MMARYLVEYTRAGFVGIMWTTGDDCEEAADYCRAVHPGCTILHVQRHGS
jgi:hypothetical protein